jgi:coenzyme F420-0:L-glutamate ligase/coenzyme F420-1:gamma-L-glutamate ligase
VELFDALRGRRSIRRFASRPVPRALLDELISAACLAPAPHHTRPWRFVVVGTEARDRLAEAMGARWHRDLEADGVPDARIAALLARSRAQIRDAPALLLACLVPEGLRAWPDEARRQAEWLMAVQSMGAALQNLMLAAHARGLGSFWVSAPLFCPEGVREALDLPEEYVAQALIALGHPDPATPPLPRPELDLAALMLER